jgi:large subunit ribosomal protein L31
MKENTHPKVFDANVSCACGTKFKTISTRNELKTEICSACHPFYTGKQKQFTGGKEGRVEKFRRRFGLTSNEIEA